MLACFVKFAEELSGRAGLVCDMGVKNSKTPGPLKAETGVCRNRVGTFP